jgi:hypothetical protein
MILYNLIVTADSEAWQGQRHTVDLSRFGEYTVESLKARYRPLDPAAITELATFPTLFAFEQPHGLPARVGRVTNIARSSRGAVRFEYSLFPDINPIPAETLRELAWELDIVNWEMHRTHWAIKDVDLIEVLAGNGLASSSEPGRVELSLGTVQPGATSQLIVRPSVFSVPDLEQDPSLVAVMMPIRAEFASVYAAVRTATQRAGFNCERADDIWDESAVIQDVFNLIYRSAVVVVDLSGQNPNVMYETGIAHTLGRPVVPIANSVERLPFDLAHHRTLGYLPNGEGLEELITKLERRLRHFRPTS